MGDFVLSNKQEFITESCRRGVITINLNDCTELTGMQQRKQQTRGAGVAGRDPRRLLSPTSNEKTKKT
nr:MAG TPA: hypothetical protein [Caudoviricetes sp.]